MTLVGGYAMINPSSATAAGDNAEVQHEPFTTTIYNPCCDEEIEIEGMITVIMRESEGPSGNIHVVQMERLSNVTGTGESGTVYHGNGHSKFGVNARNDASVGEGSQGLKWNLRSNNGCSFTITLKFHVTINNNGDVVVETIVEDIKCQNGTEIE